MNKKIIIIISIILIITISIFMIFKSEEYRYININNIDIKIPNITTNNASYRIDLDKYKKEYDNDEIVGQISILNTDFSMLFAQSNDNSYYLDHLLNKEYNKLGSTFLDYRTNIDSSKKINIYGHNNNNVGVSFNYIMNYENEDFFNKYNKIIINTKLNNYTYEIFSIQIVDSNYIHMKVDFNTASEFNEYLDNVLANSLYKLDIDKSKVKRVLTLQTCTNRKDGQYLLVNASLVS